MKLQKQQPGIYYVRDEDNIQEDRKIKVGEWVEVKKAKKERSTPEHRLVFKVARKTLNNISNKTDAEDFIKTSMLHLGKCKKYKINGKLYEVPYSLKFSEMDQDYFHKMSKELFELWAMMLKCTVKELVGSIGDID